ncbi:MAG: hypothetical protein GC180_08290 [Bacteroidetes bacterium]|nr:hypothetical protein [Bacteroidota bacterium]
MQYQHKEPRLIIPGKDAKDQRWYILVYLWDVREGKLRRVRLYLYKDVKNKTEKLRKFERYIDKLIVEISQGLCYDEVTFKQVESNKQLEARKDYMTLSMAITATQRAKEKLRPKTHKNYIFHLN